MLLALLLLARAAAEWVEISQQHYRKPMRPTTPGETSRTPQATRNPEQNQDKNPYLHEPTRNYDVFNKPNSDFVTQDRPRNPIVNFNFDRDVNTVRVNPFLQDVSQSPSKIHYEDFVHSPTRDMQLYVTQESTKKEYSNSSITEHNWKLNIHSNGRGDAIPTKITNYNDWNDNNGDRKDEIIRKTDGSNTNIKDEAVPGKIERVPNIGSVKRVELTNTPVKSPAVNKISDTNTKRRNSIKPYEDQNYDSISDELDVKTNIFDSQEHSFSKHPINIKQYHSSSGDLITEVDNKERKPIDENKVPAPSVERHPVIYTSDKEGFPISDQNSVPGNIESTMHNVGNKISSINSPAIPKHKFTTRTDTLPDFVTKNDETIDTVQVEDKNKIKSDENRNKHHESVKIDKVYKIEKDSTEQGEDKSSSSEVKVNTMENILKFMKVVADTISKNTRRGANGKIAYLNELKHTLLDNIKSRIDATFPEEDSTSARRRSRSASPRGHVEFPSSESALMTISFLTFAVFLIKLVLQVIQTYKHKTMVMAPLMVATAGRTVATKLRAN